MSHPADENLKPYFVTSSARSFQIHFFNASTRIAGIRLIDMSGKTQQTKTVEVNDGTVSLDGEGLSSGMYLVLVSTGSSSWVEQWALSR